MPISIEKLKDYKKLYKVFNSETGQIFSHASTLQHAKQQKRIIEQYDHDKKGGSILSSMKKAANKTFNQINNKVINPAVNGFQHDVINPIQTLSNKLINGRNDYSPSIKAFLAIHANDVLLNLTLVRHPVSSLITGAMSGMTNGQFGQNMQNSNIDKLYHLMLYIRTPSCYFSLEKTEEITIKYNPTFAADDEQLQISPVPPITVMQMLDRTRSRMTDNKFFGYSGYDNNCQDFILNVVNAIGINNPTYNNFIKQQTSQLFQGQTGLRKVSNTLTGLAAKGDILMAGGKLPHKKKVLFELKHF